jgi:hypothetical protein
MPFDASPFVLWPFGIALGSWFFFEIARRMWRRSKAESIVRVRAADVEALVAKALTKLSSAATLKPLVP